MSQLDSHYLEAVAAEFRNYKRLADKAIAQLPSDESFFHALDPESNSIAVIVRHMGGNLRSRWTDFLTTDGEKPDRHRDTEFDFDREWSREELLAAWEAGWEILFGTLGSLGPDDLMKTVEIRSEPHTVVRAIERALGHAAYHSGQIVLLARHLASDSWKSLSIPRREMMNDVRKKG